METKKIKEFEHITRSEFCTHMDEYLARVDNEQIAFIIEEEGKPTLALCPATWFKFTKDGEVEFLEDDEVLPPIVIDKEAKQNAENVLKLLGCDLETAIRMFVMQIAYTASIPFPLTLPDYIKNSLPFRKE